MCALRLPESASRLFEQKWPEMPDFYKWLIYSLDSAPQEVNELYCAVRTADIEDRDPDLNFVAPDIQHILDHHFRVVEYNFTHAHELSETGWTPYMFGFIVITEESWKERGVTAVHCDKDHGKWKVTKCKHIPVNELVILDSVSELDKHFDDVRNLFDGSENDGADNQGGPAPLGEWQFAVYCTGPSETSTRMLQQSAREKIPDPRGDYSYPLSEACLRFLPRTLPPESICEDWPPTYARFIAEPIDVATREPKICALHPSLFVHVRGDDSGGLSDIEIVRMEWDHNITASDEELKRVGRESRLTTQRCEAEVLVTTLEQLARAM